MISTLVESERGKRQPARGFRISRVKSIPIKVTTQQVLQFAAGNNHNRSAPSKSSVKYLRRLVLAYEVSDDLPVVKIQVFWFRHASRPDAALRFGLNHPDDAIRSFVEVFTREQGIVNAVGFSFTAFSLRWLISGERNCRQGNERYSEPRGREFQTKLRISGMRRF